MNKLNKKLVSKLVLCIMMVSLLVFFTSCSFSSSSIDLGAGQVVDAFRHAFTSLIDGVVMAVVGFGEGIWQLIVGICTVAVGAVAWVWEFIVGLF